jgi:hypothetical protein
MWWIILLSVICTLITLYIGAGVYYVCTDTYNSSSSANWKNPLVWVATLIAILLWPILRMF